MDCTLRRSSGRIYVVERLCDEDRFCCVLCPILCVVSLDISSARLFFVLFIQQRACLPLVSNLYLCEHFTLSHGLGWSPQESTYTPEGLRVESKRSPGGVREDLPGVHKESRRSPGGLTRSPQGVHKELTRSPSGVHKDFGRRQHSL
jgi:hypothetical protein